MPEVIEAARAIQWRKHGGLTPLYGARELPPVAIEAIDILDSAVNAVESRVIRERRERVDQ